MLLRTARASGVIVGLLLLGSVAFALSAYVATVSPPLYGPDEKAHAGYAMALMAGDLPTIDTPIIDDPERFPQVSAALDGREGDRTHVWTANHPPLYYALSVPVLAVADSLDRPGAGLLGMRLLNTLGTAISVVLVGLIARELVPRRPAVALLAAVLATACGTFMALGGQIFNDGLGNAASSLVLLAGVRMLTGGPTRRLVILAAVAGTAAVGLRLPGVFAVALCAAAAFYAVQSRPRGGPAGRRWLGATGAAAVVGGLPAAAFGWFYLRSIRLYGDISGTAALLEKFSRQPRDGSVLSVAVDPAFYVYQFRGLFVRAFHPSWLQPVPGVLLALVIGTFMVLALVAINSRHRSLTPGLVGAWLMMFAHALLIEYSIMSFFVEGGNRHVRYVFPMLPLVLTVVAVGLLGLVAWLPNQPPARRDVIGVAVFSPFLFALAIAIQVLAVGERPQGPFPYGHTVGALWYGLVLAAAIAAALAFLVWLARRIPARVPPQPAGEQAPATPAPVMTAG